MGSILLWLGRGVYLGGGAIIGVMFEKISAFVAGLLPSNVNVRGKDGGLAWWFISAVAIAAGIVLYIVTKAITGKKKLLSMLLFASVFAIDAFAFGGTEISVITAGLLFSIAASATDTKSVAYCPEYIGFTIATVPTSFKIEVLGDGVVFSLDGTGLTNLNGIRLVGALPANTYVFHIADGYIRKNANFSIVNATAAQLDIYGWSDSEGNNFIVHEAAKAFANQDNEVPSPFIYSAFPSVNATDTFTVNWYNPVTRKVTNNTMTRKELEMYLAQVQQIADTRYNIDNHAGRIVSLQLRPSADMSYYFTRAQAVR